MAKQSKSIKPHFNLDIKTLLDRCPALGGAEEKIADLTPLIEPTIYYLDSPIKIESTRAILLADYNLSFASAYLMEGMNKTEQLTLAALTLGEELPNHSSQCFKEGKLWEGTIADLLGSEAIEILADDFFSDLQKKYLPLGLHPTPRYSPGYGDWSLQDQKSIINLLDAHKHIKVTDSFMLEPVKSITVLVGWSLEPVPTRYPLGNKAKGLCAGEVTCSSCKTWACKK